MNMTAKEMIQIFGRTRKEIRRAGYPKDKKFIPDHIFENTIDTYEKVIRNILKQLPPGEMSAGLTKAIMESKALIRS